MVIFRTLYRTTILIIIAIALQLVAPAAFASQLDDKQAQLKNLQAQIQATQGQQDNTAKQQAGVSLQIQLSSQKLVQMQRKLNDLQIQLNNVIAKKQDAEAKLSESQKELDETQANLAATKSKLAIRQNVFNNRLVGTYKSGGPSAIEFILGSQSFDDLIKRVTFIGMIAEADSKLILGMKQLAVTITNQVTQIEATKKAIDQQRLQLVSEENNIKAITANMVAEQQQLQDEVTQQQQQFAQLQQQKDQLAQTKSQLQADANTVAEQVSALKAGGSNSRAASMAHSDLENLAASFANKYGIPPKLFFALITQESGWDPSCVSSAGAIGLTQIMPYNVIAMGYNLESFINSPSDQLEAGARYLSMDYHTFGRWDYALAAYNAGSGAVMKYGGIPPYPETQNYVRNILFMAGMS